MTVATFLSRVTEQRRTGRRMARMELSSADAAELRAELAAKPKAKRCCCARHQHEARQGTGYVMTLAGVDVYVVE